ncbi:hypothetical protein K469DRAFT_218042 [Zopfia rhizophila CBS 207.26]|uniref:Uncharacterized protein n=1 Tax=Zopfia rhizophila CBS 207.26 TaxID=1314779 RepID=A0A6A6DVE4_9PEZI|nr:hypothetical protein K469DRAFT_218042 [Zopfia rhizophila CBS 207.26]
MSSLVHRNALPSSPYYISVRRRLYTAVLIRLKRSSIFLRRRRLISYEASARAASKTPTSQTLVEPLDSLPTRRRTLLPAILMSAHLMRRDCHRVIFYTLLVLRKRRKTLQGRLSKRELQRSPGLSRTLQLLKRTILLVYSRRGLAGVLSSMTLALTVYIGGGSSGAMRYTGQLALNTYGESREGLAMMRDLSLVMSN